MQNYYRTFLNEMQNSPLERRTMLETGDEALYRDGAFICGDRPLDEPDLVESITAEPHLVFFGCGHVGKALYDLAELQGMKVTVIDCRKELLTEQRFPKATRIVGEYSDLLSRDQGFISPYYCIFTHGHDYDEQCLLYALRHSHSYIGMIGSKAKVAHCMESIKAKGITDDMLARLHSPIGLSINAVTPQEIAISIMAQIISVLRQDKSAVTVDASILQTAATEPGIMVRIVEKRGSSPRSVGSMMYVTKSTVVGTIGGGSIENHAIERAKLMIDNGECYLKESLALRAGDPLDMTCGGDNTITYKRNG